VRGVAEEGGVELVDAVEESTEAVRIRVADGLAYR
jgi:hypothetical protein